MKRQIEKIMTMAVAAGLMTSMLCGEVSHAAKVKTPYYKTGVKTDYLVKDTAFYKKTGEVLSFREKYAETSGYNPVSYSVYGSGCGKQRPLTGYVILEYIYIVTGNEAEGKALYLGYMNAKGGNQNKYKLDVVSSNGSKWEVEGIQFYDSNTIYIGECPAGSGVDKSRAYIYSIQKNEL